MKFLNVFSKKKKDMWERVKSENPEGFFALAPMADVTDNPFRKVINEIGRPQLFWTEFAACDGLANKTGRKKIEKKILNFEKNQKLIIAQIFGGKAQNYKLAAEICRKKGYDGIDINMGCPQRNILKQKAGSQLIEDRVLAKEVFLETKKGAKGRSFLSIFEKEIPVSVKTRIGFNQVDMGWIEEVLSWKPAAFTIHLRTKREMSKVPAHWELMEEIKKMRDKISPQTILIGNGDVESLREGKEKIEKYGIDGVMIGRGVFKNPWIFTGKDFESFSIEEKIDLAKRHTKYFDKEFPKNKEGKRVKNFALLKKFFKVYINGFDGAKDLRMILMDAKNKKEVFEICDDFLK
jgi:tRNA-dihydrouridine synthase